MSPASCKKGKHGKFKRQKPQRQCSDSHSSSKNRNSLPCEKRTNQKQLFSPSEVSYLSSSSRSVHPPVGFPVYSDPVSTFPASSGGEELALRSLQPQSMSSSQLCCGTQSYPVFYPPNIGTFMAVFFQGFPMYAQMPQHVFLPSPQCVYPPSSYPCTTLPPAPPPCAPSPVAPHSVDQPFPASPHSSVEDQQEGQCDQALLLSSSRSSSPLQLNLLQEELPKPMELSISADVKPHAEDKCVSKKDFSCRGETDFQCSVTKTIGDDLCVRDTDFVSCFFCWLCYVGCRSQIAQEVEKAVYIVLTGTCTSIVLALSK